jgi:addiction module HigA family antidote
MKYTKIHPGMILADELEARELSANRLALDIGVPSGRITDIINGKRSITPDTAYRFGLFFKNSPQFWMNLQTTYDLALVAEKQGPALVKRIHLAEEAHAY